MFILAEPQPVPDHIPGDARPTGPRVYPLAQVAKLLGRSYPYVAARVRDGSLVAVREGGKTVVRATDLDQYLAGLTVVESERTLAAALYPFRRERAKNKRTA